MRFDAIVHAPALRHGVRLNIAEADQSETEMPDRLTVGSTVRLKFGVCCPDLSSGTVVEHMDAPESVVLAIDATTWTLVLGDKVAVSSPGLVSEDWYVS